MSGEAFRRLADVRAFAGEDGAAIQEVAGRSTGLLSHSLAVIRHPPGTASRAHHHTVADEVYFVQSGRGQVRVDGDTREVGAGDTIIIRPGQVHKVTNTGPNDLVLIVSCAPAYAVDEVRWDE
jgi:mannose-6-phosphate isomerase-like protein (cupin superfamily)